MKLYDFNNIKFYVGKSAKENWLLLDNAKNINQNYLWFHLDSFPSPYVIIYIDPLDISNCLLNECVQFAATLCKENSKYNYLKNIKIIYLPIKKLSKSTIIGEVIIEGKGKFIKL
jgi:predicted ribosome quality control (RQC) complex YloA/Tae2 family protein